MIQRGRGKGGAAGFDGKSPLTGRGEYGILCVTNTELDMPEWRNWQTPGT